MSFTYQMPRHLNQRQWLLADWFAQREQRFPGRHARFRDVEDDFGWVATRTLNRDLARLRDEGVPVMEGHLKGADYHVAEPSQRRRRREALIQGLGGQASWDAATGASRTSG